MTHYIKAMERTLFTPDSPFYDNPIAEVLWDWAKGWEDEGSEHLVVWSLETVDCAACHAPGGLIYNQDIANKYAAWWEYIDEAMDSYQGDTGERFAPETTGQLVWFAVEWVAQDMACFLRSHAEWDEWV